MDLEQVRVTFEVLGWIQLAQDRVWWLVPFLKLALIKGE
jgi:hypothetical protein